MENYHKNEGRLIINFIANQRPGETVNLKLKKSLLEIKQTQTVRQKVLNATQLINGNVIRDWSTYVMSGPDMNLF